MQLRTLYKEMLRGVLTSLVLLLAACTADELPGKDVPAHLSKGLDLVVSATPFTNKLLTKAASARTDKDGIERLDIVLASKEGKIVKVLPVDLDPGSPVVGDMEDPSSSFLYPKAFEEVTLRYHIGTRDLAGADSVFVVANYFEEDNTDGMVTAVPKDKIPTTADLRKLPITVVSDDHCTMMGEAAIPDAFGADHEHPSGATLPIQLKRTLSMVTLAIDGAGLRGGVVLMPKQVRLVNAPTQCLLGYPNVPGEGAVMAGSVMNIPAGAVVAGGKTMGQKPKVFPDVEEPHGDSDEVIPLFMFENLQGKGSNTVETEKTDFNNQCTYLQVACDYHYNKTWANSPEETGHLDRELHGTIIYKFCLGEDVINDYNIHRNKHYQVTLTLSGWGGLVEEGVVKPDGGYDPDGDVSWRVDTELGKTGVLESEINVPAGGTHVDITLVGEEYYNMTSNKTYHITYDKTGNDNFVWLKLKEAKNGETWVKNPSNAKLFEYLYKDDESQTCTLHLFVEPMGLAVFETLAQKYTNADDWINNGCRSVGFAIKDGDVEYTRFDIFQWLPLPVMEPGINAPNQAELYFSRFDIYRGKSLPWCPEYYYDKDLSQTAGVLETNSVQLHILDANGNVIVYNPLNGFHNCVAYFVTDREGEKKADFNDGEPQTVMDYAFFEAANAEPDVQKGKIAIMDPKDVNLLSHYSLASVADWQKIDKYGLQDPRSPLISGTSYWTSDIDQKQGTLTKRYKLNGQGTGNVVSRPRASLYPGRLVFRKGDKAESNVQTPWGTK